MIVKFIWHFEKYTYLCNRKQNVMNNKSILMPHSCQKIGWGLLILTALIILVKAVFFAHDIDTMWYLAKGAHLTLLLALFFVCLSKEKVEDEMISSLRLRAAGITAYAFFLVFLALSLVLELQLYRFFPRFDGTLDLYMSELFLIVLPLLLFGLYIVLFKGMLRRSRKEQAL